MNKLKLLIAEGSEELRGSLVDALRGVYQVKQCDRGDQAQAHLTQFRPDLLVLDLMLPGLDGITLLQWMADAGIQPMVLVTTRFANDYVLGQLEALGVGYVLIKPCSLSSVVAHLSALSGSLQPRVAPRRDPRTQVTNLLLSLGVPTKLRGYAYLREAVLLRMADPTQSITKELYPEVARICGCAPAHVERSIRSAIAAAWERRDAALWRMYFSAGQAGGEMRPSNGAFLTRLAESLSGQEQDTPA